MTEQEQKPTLDLEEFRRAGYLLEINRVILHPLGLALGITHDENGKPIALHVIDGRNDKGGIVFAELDELDQEKSIRVAKEMQARSAERTRVFGFIVQPIPSRIT